MTIQEVIDKLQEIKDSEGNIEVWAYDIDDEECRLSEIRLIPGSHYSYVIVS